MTTTPGENSRSPIEDYLDQLLTASARMAPRQRRHLLAEAEDHLRTDAHRGIARGLDPVAAEREAVSRFGGAGELVRADRGRNLSPLAMFGMQLLNTGTLLAGLGAIAVGVSGLIAAVIRVIGGNHALVGSPAAGSLAPADCARWLHLAPHAASCSVAAADNWADETIYYRLALGLCGVGVLLVRRALIHRAPRVLGWALPPLATDTIAVLFFGAAAAWTLGAGLDTLAVSPHGGAGQWFSAMPVALIATAYFARRLINEVNHSSA